jgi:hypothetical protein
LDERKSEQRRANPKKGMGFEVKEVFSHLFTSSTIVQMGGNAAGRIGCSESACTPSMVEARGDEERESTTTSSSVTGCQVQAAGV